VTFFKKVVNIFQVQVGDLARVGDLERTVSRAEGHKAGMTVTGSSGCACSSGGTDKWWCGDSCDWQWPSEAEASKRWHAVVVLEGESE
jgi:hypothetical protein